MSEVSENQLEFLDRPFLVGLLSPGIQTGANTLAACNTKYFAYATILSVYCYHIRDYRLANIIGTRQETIYTLSFSQVNPDVLVLSVGDALWVVNVDANDLIMTIKVSEKVVSIGSSADDRQIICFCRFFASFDIFETLTG
jgi:hypothetical protein